MSRRVAIVGGGISGLVAAFRLESLGYEATVFEADAKPGGKIRSGTFEGVAVEEGPDAFFPRDQRPHALLRDIGLDDQLVSPAVFGAYIWHHGALRRLPPGSPYGIPRYPYQALRAGLLSPRGAARATFERLWPRPLAGSDISIGDFVRTRFGAEVAERMVDPLLAGVRGGRSERISLAAAAREIDTLARSHRSVARALRAQGPPEVPRFIAPRAGMEALTTELVTRLRDVRTNHPVEQMAIADGRVQVAGSSDLYDAAIVTIPAFAAARVLAQIEPSAAALLRTIEYASVATATLAYPRGSVHVPPDGSGFLVPSHSGLGLSACTWYSTKWPAADAGDSAIMRAVVGRSGTDPILDLDDAVLVERVHRDLVTTMGVGSSPVATRVTRWDRSIPQYGVGHLELVAQIEERLAAAGPITVAGAGYRGSGIPDCIAQAERSVATIHGSLGGPGG